MITAARAAYYREWRRKNRERLVAYDRARNKKGDRRRPGSAAAAARLYRRRYPDRVRASKLAWTAKNRERVNEQQRLRRPRYRARTTAWNARNRARINQQQRARYYRNRARRLLMARARYERRRAHFLAACRRYRQQNQARVKATCAGWHRRHPESHRKSVNNYNFRRRTRGLPPDAIEMRRVLLALRRWLKAHQLRLADFT